jgi:hypothetical protein
MNEINLISSPELIDTILRPQTIREKAEAILGIALEGGTHFKVHLNKLDETVAAVLAITDERYPDGNIPYHSRWGHFQAGGFDRLKGLDQNLGSMGVEDRVRSKLDLVVTSVLLDAGAGMAWSYQEEGSGQNFSRSEGLAVASYHLFQDGLFSSHSSAPFQADSEGLRKLSLATFAKAFQVSEENPLVGLEGRFTLLGSLGETLRAKPEFFFSETHQNYRIGHLLDTFKKRVSGGKLEASSILDVLQRSLGSIWPGRLNVDGFNLGDVWEYPPLGAAPQSWVPFHKLSQWLSYSLIEPLEEAGLEIVNDHELTGLAEYRNGGLFLDGGVLELRTQSLQDDFHLPSSELIIEWRALTLALLDRLAERLRQKLRKTKEEYPLARILEGGTWAMGRKLANERRSDGGPPLKIQSDGTVF